MNKNTLGIFGLLVAIFAITALLNDKFISAYNMQSPSSVKSMSSHD